MPELPEVETIRRGLSEKIVGKKIAVVLVRQPRIISGSSKTLAAQLIGQTVHSLDRHGKKLFINFPSFSLFIHLRMTGQLLLLPRNTRLTKHAHIVVQFSDGNEELQYHDIRTFGRWKIMARGRTEPTPDAWLASNEHIVAALRNKSGMIKHALLNQNVISGLGNIYVDETLYRAKIHPKKKIQKLSAETLSVFCRHMKEILGKSISIGGTSFRNYVDADGQRGGFKDWLFVYGKQGTKCACGATIRRIVVAQRGTHFCPRCQPAPRKNANR